MSETHKRKIVICDDEDATRRSWAEELEALSAVQSNFEVAALPPAEFRAAIEELEERQRRQRSGSRAPSADTMALDHADIVIVDFDLLELEGAGSTSSETGERIAYLARAYSSCGYIVALNQFNRGAEPVFDLTLRGHPASFADLNISSTEIANPALWTDERTGFRPWAWPCLHDSAASMERRVDYILNHLEDPILATLGFDSPSVLPHFSRDQLGFLSNHNPERATFASFVTDSSGGLRGKDTQHEILQQARIAAARIHKWLERMVLPAQSILVDAPHLATRFPSLVAAGSHELDDWQKLAAICEPAAFNPSEAVPAANFDSATWLSRPAWLWPALQSASQIAEVSDPFSPRFASFRFAEDVSMFEVQERVREFTPEIESPWLSRYVIDPDALPEGHPATSGDFEISRVQYQPAIQFAL